MREDHDHEADDRHPRLRRRSDARTRRVARGPQGRLRARRMGPADLRRRGRDVPRRSVPTRRRVPVRPADLRDLRRLLGHRLLGCERGRQPHRQCVEHQAQVRRIDDAHRPAVGGHDRTVRRRRGRRPRAEGQAGRRAAGARQRRPGPLARRQQPGRRDHPAHLSPGRRPGHATVPRRRPGHNARPGRLPSLPEWHHAPGLPAHRAPAVRNGHADRPTRGADPRCSIWFP